METGACKYRRGLYMKQTPIGKTGPSIQAEFLSTPNIKEGPCMWGGATPFPQRKERDGYDHPFSFRREEVPYPCFTEKGVVAMATSSLLHGRGAPPPFKREGMGGYCHPFSFSRRGASPFL